MVHKIVIIYKKNSSIEMWISIGFIGNVLFNHDTKHVTSLWKNMFILYFARVIKYQMTWLNLTRWHHINIFTAHIIHVNGMLCISLMSKGKTTTTTSAHCKTSIEKSAYTQNLFFYVYYSYVECSQWLPFLLWFFKFFFFFHIQS